jgi:preprotein translocase SecE subunit
MADTTDPKPKKRLVKKAETVREKAERVTTETAQPRRLHKTKRRIGAPFRLIGRIGRRLNKIKFFRIIGYIIVAPYFRNSFRELKHVTWPKFRESIRLTSAVILFAAVFGILVALVDFLLDKVFKQVLLK